MAFRLGGNRREDEHRRVGRLARLRDGLDDHRANTDGDDGKRVLSAVVMVIGYLMMVAAPLWFGLSGVAPGLLLGAAMVLPTGWWFWRKSVEDRMMVGPDSPLGLRDRKWRFVAPFTVALAVVGGVTAMSAERPEAGAPIQRILVRDDVEEETRSASSTPVQPHARSEHLAATEPTEGRTHGASVPGESAEETTSPHEDGPSTTSPSAGTDAAPGDKDTEGSTTTPTTEPSVQPTEPAGPTIEPSVQPTEPAGPTIEPSVQPTKPAEPTIKPTVQPTKPAEPTIKPTVQPTEPAVPTETD